MAKSLFLGGSVGGLDDSGAIELVGHMSSALDRLSLDLHGLKICTEAATGYYAALPVMAAMAGAQVVAVPADNRFGTRDESVAAVESLSRRVKSSLAIQFEAKDALAQGTFDVLTNSAALRPIDSESVGLVRPGGVVSLMYEAWERRDEDVDLDACRERGVGVVGVNENHVLVDSFRFCGPLAVAMVEAAGVEPSSADILVVGSDRFSPVVVEALSESGAKVTPLGSLGQLGPIRSFDAIVHTDLVPMPDLSSRDLWRGLSEASPAAVVVQFSGGLPMKVIRELGLAVFPDREVFARTMGWTLAELSGEPVVRLMAGALKAAEEHIHQTSGDLVGQPVL